MDATNAAMRISILHNVFIYITFWSSSSKILEEEEEENTNNMYLSI